MPLQAATWLLLFADSILAISLFTLLDLILRSSRAELIPSLNEICFLAAVLKKVFVDVVELYELYEYVGDVGSAAEGNRCSI